MPANASCFRVGDLEIRFHLPPEISHGTVSIFESVIPPGARVPIAHRHIGYDETVHGLAGTCHFTVEGREISLSVGETLFVPRGAAHSFVNRGFDMARVLVVVTPGLLGPGYFEAVATLVNAGGAPDRVRIGELMQRHGMEPVLDRND